MKDQVPAISRSSNI